MTAPQLIGASNPVMRAARHFGVDTAYAYLIADMTLRAVCPDRGVWPEDHHWHLWAVKHAEAQAGRVAVRAFVLAMADYFSDRHPAEVRAA